MTSVFFNCAAPAAAIVEHSAFSAIAADGMLFWRRFILAHWRYIFRFDFQSVGKTADVREKGYTSALQKSRVKKVVF